MPIRTEKEKMLAGEIYNCLDPELEAERQKAKKLMRRYNQTEAEPERQLILQQMLGAIGQNSTIWSPFYCAYGQNTYLGDNVFLSYMSTILDTNEVHIGNHVIINLDVTIGHDTVIENFCTLAPGVHISGRNKIGAGANIGTGAVTIQGISIGRWSVIGAGAVVVGDIPDKVVAVGVPAKAIKGVDVEN